MTLVISNDAPLVKSSDVHFVVLDGTKRTHCVVSREALEDAARIGTEGMKGRELDLFEQFGMEIGRVVNRKYDLGQVEANGTVVIRSKDLNI